MSPTVAVGAQFQPDSSERMAHQWGWQGFGRSEAHHPLMRCHHKPEDEKRKVDILPQEACESWQQAGPQDSRGLMRAFDADQLLASSPKQPRTLF